MQLEELGDFRQVGDEVVALDHASVVCHRRLLVKVASDVLDALFELSLGSDTDHVTSLLLALGRPFAPEPVVERTPYHGSDSRAVLGISF